MISKTLCPHGSAMHYQRFSSGRWISSRCRLPNLEEFPCQSRLQLVQCFHRRWFPSMMQRTDCSSSSNSIRTPTTLSVLRQFSFGSGGGGGGIVNRIRGFLETRQEEKKVQKIQQQIEMMASLPTWNLKAFVNELDSALSDWTTKIPGMGNTKAIKEMKENKRILNVFVEELGENAQLNDLIPMDRKQKLTISIKGDVVVEDINSVIQQFRIMDLMHRVLRYRKANGKPLPTDEAGMRTAMMEDAQIVMTNQERKEMREEALRRRNTTTTTRR